MVEKPGEKLTSNISRCSCLPVKCSSWLRSLQCGHENMISGAEWSSNKIGLYFMWETIGSGTHVLCFFYKKCPAMTLSFPTSLDSSAIRVSCFAERSYSPPARRSEIHGSCLLWKLLDKLFNRRADAKIEYEGYSHTDGINTVSHFRKSYPSTTLQIQTVSMSM